MSTGTIGVASNRKRIRLAQGENTPTETSQDGEASSRVPSERQLPPIIGVVGTHRGARC